MKESRVRKDREKETERREEESEVGEGGGRKREEMDARCLEINQRLISIYIKLLPLVNG